jgi:hypothetical protein
VQFGPTQRQLRTPAQADIDGVATGETPDAGDGSVLPRPHPEMGRRHRGRRLLVHDPCPPRRRGDHLGPLRDGIDHAWRERPLRGRAHPQCHSIDQPRRPVRAALWANGAADFVHDPGIALHEDLWSLARAIVDGLGRAARMGGEEPARHLQDADHRRGRAELADDRLPVSPIAMLSG